MDWDSLLEEIEDMGASHKRALRSYYYRLVEHILKRRATAQIAAANAESVQVCRANSTAIAVRDLDANASAYWDAERDINRTKWRVEVSNFRRAIKDILEDSPSLNNYLQDNHLDWYNKTIDNYTKNQLFPLKDKTVIPLSKMIDDDYFGD